MPAKRRNRREWSYSLVADQAAAFCVSFPAQPAKDRFLSPNDVGKILNVTGEAVKQWIYHHRLPAVKLANGYWKVKASDLQAFLKAKHEIVRRVLLIGGSNNGMDDVVEVLNQLGHIPITSTNYVDSILKLKDATPALVIIDCSSRSAEAWAFAQRIRETKALRGIPILLMADCDLSDTDAQKAVEISAKGFIKRPVDSQILSGEIQRILQP